MTNTLTVQPRQILGLRPARRHERPGLYPIYAIAGGSEPGGDAGSSDAGQQAGQAAGQASGQNDAAAGTQSSDTGSKGTDAGQSSGQGDGQDAGNVWDDPTKAKAEIERLRRENGNARTSAKQQAAEEARQEVAQTIGKALGLIKDDEKVDPAKLAEQVQAAQTAQREAAVQLAVFKTATKHGGDPAALTDSRSFLVKVADLDPTASDFEAKVIDAAKAAVDANQTLKAGRAPGASSVDHGRPGGERRGTEPKPLADAVSGHYGT